MCVEFFELISISRGVYIFSDMPSNDKLDSVRILVRVPISFVFMEQMEALIDGCKFKLHLKEESQGFFKVGSVMSKQESQSSDSLSSQEGWIGGEYSGENGGSSEEMKSESNGEPKFEVPKEEGVDEAHLYLEDIN